MYCIFTYDSIIILWPLTLNENELTVKEISNMNTEESEPEWLIQVIQTQYIEAIERSKKKYNLEYLLKHMVNLKILSTRVNDLYGMKKINTSRDLLLRRKSKNDKKSTTISVLDQNLPSLFLLRT